MSYEAQCPKGHRLRVTEAHFDKQVACPTCGTPFVVPNLAAPAAAAAAATPAQPANGDFGVASMVPPLKRNRKSAGLGSKSLPELAGTFGRPMLGLGLVLVLLARGCDSIGQRGVESAHSRLSDASLFVTAPYDREIRRYDQKIKTLEKAEKPDAKAIDDAKESRKKQQEKRKDALETFQAETLPELQLAAATAAASNISWAYWREWLFVLGAIALTLALLGVSWIAEGAERMVCLIMLAIIAFSIFIGGIAWIPIPRSIGGAIPHPGLGAAPGISAPAQFGADCAEGVVTPG
jgi:hypothetical protein